MSKPFYEEWLADDGDESRVPPGRDQSEKDSLMSLDLTTRTGRQMLMGQITLGTAAVQFPQFKAYHGVMIKAHNGNAGICYIGNRESVQAAGGAGIGGFELYGGQAVRAPVRELSDLWGVASVAGQVVSFWAI